MDTAVAEKAAKIWKGYYDIALDMEKLVTNSSENSVTVKDYLANKTVEGEAVKYDPAYANVQLKDFAGSSTTSFLAYGMKVFRMIPMTRANREINIRMQYGLNAVRDSTMYTYDDEWVADVDARNATDTVFAYTRGMSVMVGKTAITGSNLAELVSGVKRNPTVQSQTWETPLLYVLRKASLCQSKLTNAANEEQGALYQLQQK